VRNYPEQPPVIPHTTQGYQIDINGNKCLSCHAGTCTAPHWLAGDAVLIAPVSRQIPC
jgi:nitrate reductase cytochrome c-type subunit